MDKIELADLLDSFSRAYPEDVFPPLTEDERKALPRGIIDRCSGAMGRHFAKFAAQAAAALRESEEWRRDAERYRWLRTNPPNARVWFEHDDGFGADSFDGDDFDAAIDSARGVE